MDYERTQREQLSALADGQLQGTPFIQAVDFSTSPQGQATWAMYHLVGDVLRSPELARPHGSDVLAAVRAHMASEPRPALQTTPLVSVVAPADGHQAPQAANASVFRWKMVAGFASLAAVSAIGWSVAMQWQNPGQPGQPGAQLAAVPAPQTLASSDRPLQAASAAPGQRRAASVTGLPESPYMLRDPRLDELLAAHKQYGTTTSLQMPAGFLRNATFEAPARKP